MEDIRTQIQTQIDELKTKLSSGEKANEADLQVLLLARLMEEEVNEQQRQS